MSNARKGSAMSNRASLGQNKDADTVICKGSGHSSVPSHPTVVASPCHTNRHAHESQSPVVFCICLGRVFLTAPQFCLACVCWVAPCHRLEFQERQSLQHVLCTVSVCVVCGYTSVSVSV